MDCEIVNHKENLNLHSVVWYITYRVAEYIKYFCDANVL